MATFGVFTAILTSLFDWLTQIRCSLRHFPVRLAAAANTPLLFFPKSRISARLAAGTFWSRLPGVKAHRFSGQDTAGSGLREIQSSFTSWKPIFSTNLIPPWRSRLMAWTPTRFELFRGYGSSSLRPLLTTGPNSLVIHAPLVRTLANRKKKEIAPSHDKHWGQDSGNQRS